MVSLVKDKSIERERYDSRALSLLRKELFNAQNFGSDTIPLPLRLPYLFYEEKIKEIIKPIYSVLEVGFGTGLHTYSLIKTGATVTASDISPNSLIVLKKNLSTVGWGGKLWLQI
jgi:2-polyprenyl-3-methyl-5-hydroxy-6-metoxy-1,4-benzoquinol methylase